jgi:Putative prokaryotic signal transducing protein
MMQKVFIAHDLIEANFIKDLLRRGGIAAEVQGETLPHIDALLPSVWIMEDAQLKKARALIEDFERRKKLRAV